MVEEKKSPELFVRKASGLVRDVGWLEATFANYNGVGTIWLTAFSMFFIYMGVPQGDATVALLVVGLLGLFGYTTSYAMLTASWPRSGARYVAESRILHPLIGFVSEMGLFVCLIVTWAVSALTVFVYWGLGGGLFVTGLISGNQTLIDLSYLVFDPTWSFVLATIFMLVPLVPLIFGIRKLMWHWQMPLTILSLATWVGFIIILATTDHATFVQRFNTLVGQPYDQVIQIGKEVAPDAMGPMMFTPLIFMMAIGVLGSSTNTYWNAWSVGEMKGAGELKKQFFSFNLACLFCMASQIISIWLLQNVAGRDFLIAATQVSMIAPDRLAGPLLYGGSMATFVPMLLSPNTGVAIFFVIGLVAATLVWSLMVYLPTTRTLFAISFDRVLPSKLAAVDKRFHSPWVATLIVFIGCEIVLLLQIFGRGWVATLIPGSFTLGAIPPIVANLTVALFPLRKKYYDQSPLAKLKIGPIPVATVVGLIGAASWINCLYWLSTTPQLGYGGPTVWSLIVGVYSALVVLYLICYFVRKAQGIDLSLVAKEIPPV